MVTKINTVEQQKKFTQLKERGSAFGGRDNEGLSYGILRERSTSAASSSRGSRGRYPIPLDPEIQFLLNRLEPDKGKQARLLMEHLSCQRTLPCTAQELKMQL
jgi:hypothetical protein